MKKTGKEYSFRSTKNVLSERSCRAAGRAESYSFRTKYDPPVLSVEAMSNMHAKLNTFDDASTMLWQDRGSRIAIPYGSEMFLSNERGIESVMMGSTRNFFHDLPNAEREPDARSKFPYDQDAHTGANKIKRLFQQNLQHKNEAARIIQRSTKNYMVDLAVNEQVRHTNELISKVQKKFRYTKKRLRDTRLRREEADADRASALKVEQHAMFLQRLSEEKDSKLSRGWLCLTRE